MFARYYVELAGPFDAVETSLFDDPGTWIPGLLEAAEDRGHHLLAEVGLALGSHGRRVDKKVQIELGTPQGTPSVRVLPITWRATGAQWLFPRLDGDIELASLGSARTQLSINARYQPPLGVVGRVMDRALLHRVAEATLKDSIEGVAEHLDTQEPASPRG
jgi:hypothetical protein